MNGESDLATLLKTLKVRQRGGVWRFETFKNNMVDGLKSINPSILSVMVFKEREGTTVITSVEADTPTDNHWVWLEMSVHSDLNAVGFLARIAAALSEAGVPCNAVAGYYHDHIFVPEDKADVAVSAIEALAGSATP